MHKISIDRHTPIVGDSFDRLARDLNLSRLTYNEFTTLVKKHLSWYKENKLNVAAKGTWRNTDYPHILPSTLDNMNLIGFTKDDVNRLNGKIIKFHDGFSHLNSSQAMCMNFFYPQIRLNDLSSITKLLNFRGVINEVGFEKDSFVEPANYRKTNFDFFMSVGDKKVYFEIKYTEYGFGVAEKDDEHSVKFNDVYKNYCVGNEAFINQNIDELTFLDNYQIMRNFIVLDKDSYVVFIYPKENISVRSSILKAKNEFISDEFYHHVILLTWEELVDYVVNDSNSIELGFGEFKRKYLEYREEEMSFVIENLSEANITASDKEGIREMENDDLHGETRGKKSGSNKLSNNHHVNQIPSDFYGPCYSQLNTYIYDLDDFDERILQSFNLALDPDQCYGTCKSITFYSTQWIPGVLVKYSGLLNAAKREHISITFHIYINRRRNSFAFY